MGYHQGSELVAVDDFMGEPDHLVGALGVEGGGVLVEQEQFGLEPRRHKKREGLSLPAGEGADGVVEAVFKAHVERANARAEIFADLAVNGDAQRARLAAARGAFRRVILIALAAVGILAAALATFPVFAQLYWTRLFNSFQYFIESPNAILSGRLDSWKFLIQFISSHPLYALLGVGYKTLPYSTFLGQTVIADNTYLSLFIETGVAGVAAMLAMSLAILRASRRAALSGDARASFFGSWIFCFWFGEMAQMMSGDILTYWRVLPVYFFVLALAVRV